MIVPLLLSIIFYTTYMGVIYHRCHDANRRYYMGSFHAALVILIITLIAIFIERMG